MKNPAAFISYARRDDRAYGGRIKGLCQRLEWMAASAIGRDIEISLDCEGIVWGQHWPTRLDEALEEALFLIPILTPSYFNSQACRAELEMFLELERRSGRKDRILSLYVLTAPVYEQKNDALAAILHDRQHRDWRHLRIDPLGSAKVMRALDNLARELANAIYARQADTSAPACMPHPATKTPQARDRPPAPAGIPGHSPTAPTEEPSTVLRQAEIRAGDDLALSDSTVLSRRQIRQVGTIFRDIDASWCPTLVVIPSGMFVRGSPVSEPERREAEGPQHKVKFSAPLAIGRYPVTFDEYDHFCSETGKEEPDDSGWGRGRRPAINVSWEDAQAYCAWLSEQTKQLYRLPSEAEWEYACRAGTTTPFWTGATISTDQANYDGSYAYGSGRKGECRGRRCRSTPSRRIPGACTTCTATYGSGARTAGTIATRQRRWMARLGCRASAPCAWCAAAPGSSNQEFYAPRIASGSSPTSDTTIWVFGSPGR